MSWGDTFNRNKATGMDPSAAAFIADQSEPARKRKLEEKNMTAAQQVEPYGYAFQHEETGLQQVVDVQQVEWGFEKNNPRWQKLGPVYLHPPAPQMRGLKHPEYAHGISDVELIKEALAFCDEELDAYEGLEYDDDCEVCCQRSNTFIRELVHRLEVANVATPASAPQVKPDYWAIHSATGIHIGLWPDKADADEALREYEGGTITPLYRAPPPAPRAIGTQTALDQIAAERRRQIEEEGFSAAHDDAHSDGDMALAAACYALNASPDDDGPEIRFLAAELWPWSHEWFKPSADRKRDLVKAGALIVAELERTMREEDHEPRKIT